MIIKAEDKMRARLQAMRYVLDQFDYEGKDLTDCIEQDPLILAPVASLRNFSDD